MATLAVLFSPQLVVSSRADYREAFDSPEPTLRLADADCAAEVLAQERVFQRAHGGVGCERVLLRAGRGTRIYLDQTIVPAQVIDELKIHLWIKSERPGLQLLARVVLPRTIDRRTGQPLTTLVWGSSYHDVGGWQLLTIANLPKLVERQVRVLNSERNEAIDAKQAYVDKVVLNAYGGAGVTQLWIDDLEIEGHTTPPSWSEDRRLVEPTAAPKRPSDGKAEARAATAVRSDTERGVEAAARLQGSLLVVQGKPFFPRAVIDRGESWSWLRSLGFNTLFLGEQLTPEQIVSGEKLGLWFVVPSGRSGDSPRANPGRVVEASSDVTRDRILAELVPHGERPAVRGRRLRLVGIPARESNDRFDASSGDLFMTREYRSPAVGNGASSAGDAQNPAATPILPGRPTWMLIDTEQLVHDALDDAPVAGELRRERLRSALRGAVLRGIAAGARGLCFSNSLPESLRDADIPRWTAVVEVVLRELDAISPWVAGGTPPEPLSSPAADWSAFAIEANRSRLLILTTESPSGLRINPATTPRGDMSLRPATWGETAVRRRSATVPQSPPLDVIDPGAPTSADAYLLGDSSLRPIARQRVAGGVRLSVETTETAALVVLTQDPLVVGYLARRGAAAQSSGPRASVAGGP